MHHKQQAKLIRLVLSLCLHPCLYLCLYLCIYLLPTYTYAQATTTATSASAATSATTATTAISATTATSAGGVQFLKHPSLSIQRQDVNLSLDQVTVNYIFINNSALDLIETMVFPVPTLNADKAYNHNEEPLQNFSVAANGRDIDVKTMVRPISFSGEDLYTFFSSLGISSNPLEAMAQINANYNSFASAKNTLLQRNLIDPNTNTAKWFTRTYYYWQQKFPPAEEIHIQQTYKPNITIHRTAAYSEPKTTKNSKESIDPNSAFQKELALFNSKKSAYTDFLRQYCPSKNDLSLLLNSFSNQKNKNQKITSRALNFDLRYDNNWSSPIAHFTLKITQPENSLALLCWPEPMQRIDDTTVIYEAKNYSAIRNIHLLFVNK